MATVMALSLMTGCGSKNNAANKEFTGNAVINAEEMDELFKDVPDFADEGAQIYLSDTKAKAGELAEVTLSVKNAEKEWNMCGIHIVYPEVLKPELTNTDERAVKYKAGDAIEAATGTVCMEWQSGLPQILTDKKQGCIFFTTMFSGNQGLDGDMATFYFKVPDNAQSGAVYNIGYYYMNTDLFVNEQNIPSYQKYAFTHMQGGTITVE